MIDYYRYIQSDRWKKFRAGFFRAGWPQVCLACQKPDVTLHHVSYKNLGCERFRDVVPLCWDCHKKLHEQCGKTSACGLDRFRVQLVQVFGLTSETARRRLRQWYEVGEEKKLTKKQVIKRRMAQDKLFHEQMCSR